jgi:hypothetical protein
MVWEGLEWDAHREQESLERRKRAVVELGSQGVVRQN